MSIGWVLKNGASSKSPSGLADGLIVVFCDPEKEPGGESHRVRLFPGSGD
jgi:hypothetical protein